MSPVDDRPLRGARDGQAASGGSSTSHPLAGRRGRRRLSPREPAVRAAGEFERFAVRLHEALLWLIDVMKHDAAAETADHCPEHWYWPEHFAERTLKALDIVGAEIYGRVQLEQAMSESEARDVLHAARLGRVLGLHMADGVNGRRLALDPPDLRQPFPNPGLP